MVRALPLVVSLVAFALTAQGAEIRVRSRTSVGFEVARTARGLEVRGRLEDDARRGVGAREVTLTIDGWDAAATLRTGDDGDFALTLGPDDLDALLRQGGRRLSVDVAWAGDTRFGPARERRAVDVDKVDVDLSATVVPTMVLLGERRDVRLIAEAYAQGRPLDGLEVSVRIGGGGERTIRTGPDGRAVVALSTAAEEHPGEVPVTARAPESADTNEATAATTFLLVSPTTLSLDATPEEGATPAVRVTGLARDAGGPVEGALVTLVADDLPLALAVTDAEGRFGARLTRRTISDACRAAGRSGPPCEGGRSLRLRAAWSPAEPWRRPSVSAWVDATLPMPPRVPFGAYLGALAVALALLGLLQLGRLRPLAALRAWLAARRPAPVPPRPAATAPVEAAPPPPRARLVDGVAGMVVDRQSGRPVVGAIVAAEGLPTARADRDGAFVLAPLPPGPVDLAVRARGYLDTRVPVVSPHPGRLVVSLASIRAEAAAVYRAWAAPRVGDEAFGLLTPREIATAVAHDAPAERPTAERVTDAFEHVYFGAEDEGPAAVDRVRAAADPGEGGR